jgi:hypothetical protein
MTPNGAILFAVLAVGASIVAATPPAFAVLVSLCAAFGAVETLDRMRTALMRSLAIMAPLALFMGLVWVGIVGRSPAEIATGATGTRLAALAHVATICMRLLLVVLIIQLVALRFAHASPLQFIRALSAPAAAKKLIVLTLSWIDTILHAVDRSRIALVASGLITPRLSLRNAANGWVLVQTAWLSALTIATGRLRDKWPAEDTPARLDALLATPAPALTAHDWGWIAAAGMALVVATVA